MSFPEKSLLAIPRVTHTSSLKQVVRLSIFFCSYLSYSMVMICNLHQKDMSSFTNSERGGNKIFFIVSFFPLQAQRRKF